MIESINLYNFKAFKNSGIVDFKKINIFLGPNSSGKSSFIKALLTLQNTMNNEESAPALYLNDDIGAFEDIVYYGTSDRRITFDIKFKQNYSFQENDVKSFLFEQEVFPLLTFKTMRKNKMSLGDITKGFTQTYNNYLNNKIIGISFSVKETHRTPNSVDNLKMCFSNGDICDITRQRNAYYLKYNDCNFRNMPNIVKPFKFLFRLSESKITQCSLEESKILINIAIALRDSEIIMKNFTKNIVHIEPFRNKPSRSQLVTNFKFNTVGPMGENMVGTLIGLKEFDNEKTKIKKELDNEKSKIKEEHEKNINKWLNDFDLAQSVDVIETSKNQYSIIINNKFTGIPCNLLDVGVGTSQLLPIIIESVISSSGSVLIIEEPETHVHPNAQAKLGELFVESANQGKKFFVETHSMYLVKQLQIAVAKGDISNPEDVGIYYFEQSKDGTHVKNLNLQKNGQFAEEIPKGFFDVPFRLSQELRKYM